MENAKGLEGRGGIPNSERAGWEGGNGGRGEKVIKDEAWLGEDGFPPLTNHERRDPKTVI